MAPLAKLGFTAFAVLATVPGATHRALADEAYLCGPNTVVYVSADDLEARKRTDPCIAAYFGLKVEGGASAAHAAVKSAPEATASQRPAKPVSLKRLESPEIAERVTKTKERSAALEPPVASPGTDFRNVRVLNAASGDGRWFKHLR
ncbi:MAG: hypothetical protein ABL907_12820 [Hyphomicrobium sp.]